MDESAVAHVDLGRVLLAAGDAGEAARHDQRALELRPSQVEVHVSLAQAWHAEGRLDEARAELARALAAEPGLAPAHAELGLVLSDSGDDAGALISFRRAVGLAPADLGLRNHLAWVLATSRSQARPEEALALARQLCQLTHDAQAGFLETLAAAQARLGHYAEAVDAQTRALERVPAAYRALLAERLELYRKGQPYLKSP